MWCNHNRKKNACKEVDSAIRSQISLDPEQILFYKVGLEYWIYTELLHSKTLPHTHLKYFPPDQTRNESFKKVTKEEAVWQVDGSFHVQITQAFHLNFDMMPFVSVSIPLMPFKCINHVGQHI